jgi:pyridoxine 5-phosphate synthase
MDEVPGAVLALHGQGIVVSLFIDPQLEQVKAAKRVGADFVEFHTGAYADAFELHRDADIQRELGQLQDQVVFALKSGLRVNAGHGLNYRNVGAIAQIDGIEELNIGHSIIGRAALVGLERAVKDMLDLI